jgi:hypothetical protein
LVVLAADLTSMLALTLLRTHLSTLDAGYLLGRTCLLATHGSPAKRHGCRGAVPTRGVYVRVSLSLLLFLVVVVGAGLGRGERLAAERVTQYAEDPRQLEQLSFDYEVPLLFANLTVRRTARERVSLGVTVWA